MPKPKPPSDLWDQLEALEYALHVSPERPEGAFTTVEYAEKRGVCKHTAEKRIRALMTLGHLDRVPWHQWRSDGKRHTTYLYKLRGKND